MRDYTDKEVDEEIRKFHERQKQMDLTEEKLKIQEANELIHKRMNDINTFQAHENEVYLRGTDEYGKDFQICFDSYNFIEWIDSEQLEYIKQQLTKYINEKMKTEILKEKYIKYNLTKDDVFKHQHYIIITRSGIDKIQALESIHIDYDVINCEKDFCVVKANARKEGTAIQTFGSALKGAGFKDGNTNTWYVMEMAEKRAMSRAVLKLTGFYELGVFGEDEAEDFKKSNN